MAKAYYTSNTTDVDGWTHVGTYEAKNVRGVQLLLMYVIVQSYGGIKKRERSTIWVHVQKEVIKKQHFSNNCFSE
jgi:hypothetical protein